MEYFTSFQDKLHSFNIRDNRSTRGLLISETVQKISNIMHLYGQPVLTFDKRQILRKNFKRVTLQREKEFIESTFY